MQFKAVKTVAALAVAAMMTGCATHSDSLGFAENEGAKVYSDAYAPARQMITQNRIDEIRKVVFENPKAAEGDEPMTNEEYSEQLYEKASELSLVERGLIALNFGNVDRAIFFFDVAERKLVDEEDNDTAGKTAARTGKAALSILMGSEEAANYQMRGYEKVMLLNYKALCYMLKGDRRAYNVTRRAIDRQQAEWEAFAEELEKVKADNEAQQSQMAGFDPNAATAGNAPATPEAAEAEAAAKADLEKAQSVASAYVNPFGDYMNGMMQEFDSLADPSLRDNARIAYEKAYELNDKCVVAKKAAKEVTSNKKRKGMKLVQVILADGFSPVRGEKNITVPMGNDIVVSVNLPTTRSLPSELTKATVTYGKTTTTLSSLTEVDALVLRDDLDRQPMKVGMMLAAVARSYLASKSLGKFGGMLTSSIQHPDTRSWLTLPNTIDVARIWVPENVEELTLTTYADAGRKLAQQPVKIAKKGPSVVYAVSYGPQLHAFGNSFSWVK